MTPASQQRADAASAPGIGAGAFSNGAQASRAVRESRGLWGREADLSQRRQPSILQDFRQPHIGNLGRPVPAEQHVGALEVKVHNPAWDSQGYSILHRLVGHLHDCAQGQRKSPSQPITSQGLLPNEQHRHPLRHLLPLFSTAAPSSLRSPSSLQQSHTSRWHAHRVGSQNRSLAGVEEEEAACSVQGNAPGHAGVGHWAPSGQLLAVPPEAPVHVLGDGVEEVPVLHVLLDQDGLPNLQGAGMPQSYGTFPSNQSLQAST